MDRKAIEDNSNACPPPYAAPAATQEEAFLDHAINVRRQNEDEVPAQTTSGDAETERLRNLLIFTLSIDYQCDVGGAILSASDRDHFLTLDILLADLRRAHSNARPSSTERLQLAPYFWKYLHEPCKSLGIPVEIVLGAIWRLSKFASFTGRYKGCCFGILQTFGLDCLAQKLYSDKALVIPRLFKVGPVRQRMLDGVEDISQLYFSKIHGFEGATITTDGRRNWTDVQNIRYDANERGASYEQLRKRATNAGCLSMAHLTLVAKRCAKAITERHIKTEAGVRGKDPKMTWQGDGHLLPKDTSSAYYQYHLPVD